MDQKTSNLFQVFLRLRPPPSSSSSGINDRFLSVERAEPDDPPSHITLTPPADRRRATEKFAFTRVFEEEASQLDVFHCAGVTGLVEGVVAPVGGWGTDGLVATLGVTGSGKVSCSRARGRGRERREGGEMEYVIREKGSLLTVGVFSHIRFWDQSRRKASRSLRSTSYSGA